MRITKRQLRRIIREEKTKLRCEAHSLAGDQLPSWSAFENAVWTAAVNALHHGMESDDVMLTMQDTIREVVTRVVKRLNDQGVGY
jgi:hypothetical protein